MPAKFGPAWAYELACRHHDLSPIGTGYYHFNYLVRRDNDAFILRVRDASSPRMDLVWMDEGATLRFLEEKRFPAPRLRGAGDDPAYLLLTYAEGAPLSQFAATEPQFSAGLRQLAGLLKRLHDLDAEPSLSSQSERSVAAVCARLIDFPERVVEDSSEALKELYAALAIPEAPFAAIRAGAARLRERSLVFCHGDAHPRNCIVAPDGTLLLIDWELAMFGDPMYDLAVAVHRSRLTDSARDDFLAAYAPEAPAPDRAALQIYLSIERIKSAIVDAPRTLARVASLNEEGGKAAVRDYRRKLLTARRVWQADAAADPDEASMFSTFGLRP